MWGNVLQIQEPGQAVGLSVEKHRNLSMWKSRWLWVQELLNESLHQVQPRKTLVRLRSLQVWAAHSACFLDLVYCITQGSVRFMLKDVDIWKDGRLSTHRGLFMLSSLCEEDCKNALRKKSDAFWYITPPLLRIWVDEIQNIQFSNLGFYCYCLFLFCFVVVIVISLWSVKYPRLVWNSTRQWGLKGLWPAQAGQVWLYQGLPFSSIPSTTLKSLRSHS